MIGSPEARTSATASGGDATALAPPPPTALSLPAQHPGATSPFVLRRRVVSQISRLEVRDAIFGWALYLAAAIVVLVGVLLVYTTLRSVAESGLEIVSRPFYIPVLVTTAVGAVYLAGWASLAIARPREQGALRVLFFAPVDAVSLVGAHCLAALAVYILFLLLTLPLLGLLAFFTNLPLPPGLLLGAIVSPVLVLPAIGIGLCISASAASTRAAVFLFAAALAIIAAAQLGYSALLQIPPESRYYDALLFLRDLLRFVRDALQWISPLALLSHGLDAALRASWNELALDLVAAIAGAAIWLALAIWGLRRRGVLP